MKNRIVILNTQSGDWSGLFIDGKLITEGHTIGEGSSIEFWFDLGKSYPNSTLETKTLGDRDEHDIMDSGQYYLYLDHFREKY